MANRKRQIAYHLPAVTVNGLPRADAADLAGTLLKSTAYARVDVIPEPQEEPTP